MLIGILFKKRREQLGLTRTELAEKANITRPTLRKIEGNKKNIDLAKLAQVADALDRELDIKLRKKKVN